MTNRIGGDWSAEALEAFRSAYAQHLSTPDESEVDSLTGLPTNVVTNTSPWNGIDLWKYPSGRGPEEDLKTSFNPESYLSNEVMDEKGDLSEEEIEALIDEIGQDISDDEDN